MTSYWPIIGLIKYIFACHWSLLLYDVICYRHYIELSHNMRSSEMQSTIAAQITILPLLTRVIE